MQIMNFHNTSCGNFPPISDTKISAVINFRLNRVVKKICFCICENKGADQLCSDRAADNRLCFC